MSNIDHKKFPLQTQFILTNWGRESTVNEIKRYLESGHKVISMVSCDNSGSYITVLEPPIIKKEIDEQK